MRSGPGTEYEEINVENILVSACLLGYKCKYDGGTNTISPENVDKLRQKYKLIPVCPETAGGLPTPRKPSERQGSRVVNSAGEDVTAQYIKGAECALVLAKRYKCSMALFKEKSPSCGSGKIYDGSFSRRLVSGDGVTSELLKKSGIKIVGEKSLESLI